jgi:hypothetical protein
MHQPCQFIALLDSSGISIGFDAEGRSLPEGNREFSPFH